MDDAKSAPYSPGPRVPATTKAWLTWVWIAVVAVSLIAGIIAGHVRPGADPQTGAEVFGWGAFFGWTLLAMLFFLPTALVAGLVRKGIDAQAELRTMVEALGPQERD